MSFVTSFFTTHTTQTVEFRNLTTTFVNGILTKSYPTNATLTIEAIYWTGPAADALVSEQYRPQITGVLIIDPDNYSVSIDETAKVTIDSQDYSIIYVDDVAKQGEVIQIPLKRFVKA